MLRELSVNLVGAMHMTSKWLLIALRAAIEFVDAQCRVDRDPISLQLCLPQFAVVDERSLRSLPRSI
jgi:hypothetical protein